jgi:hypothetical protein
VSFHPKDDIAFVDRSPNEWAAHPNTRRMHHAHRTVTTQLRIALARIKYLEEQVQIYKDHAEKTSRDNSELPGASVPAAPPVLEGLGG